MSTPDTEWEKELKNQVVGMLHPEIYKRTVSFINSLLTSRDTYWKERVRKEVEVTQKVVKDLLPIMWNDDAEKHASNIRLTNNLHIISKALDTLLDNLK